MVYPAECVSQLLERIRTNDPEDPPTTLYAERNRETRSRDFPHPTPEQLRTLLDGALTGSMQPEEGRLHEFALAFISPERIQSGYEVCALTHPRPFDAREIGKISSATNPNRTFIGIWEEAGGDQLQVWGLLHSKSGPLSTEPEGSRGGFLWNHAFLNVRVYAPGVFMVYHRQRLHLVYAHGEAHWGLSSGRLQAVLRDRARLAPAAAEAICHLLARMVLLQVGGTVLITDPADKVESDLLDVAYTFRGPNSILKAAVEEREARHHRKDTELPLSAALDFMAHLTTVDGALHVGSNLELYGFGGKISLQKTPAGKLIAEEANPTFEAEEASTRPLDLSEVRGMRHRSAAMFCNQQPGQALALVVSQDGDVTFFGRQPDGVVRRIGPFALGVGLGVT